MKNAALIAAVFLLSAGTAVGEAPESFGEVRFDVGSERLALVLLPGADGEAEPFYRVGGPIASPDAEEHPDCFDAAGFRYHHQACPALQQFFRQHGFDPQSVALRSSGMDSGPGAGESFRERRLPEERGGATYDESRSYPRQRGYREDGSAYYGYAPYYSYYGPYDYYGYYGPYSYYRYSPYLDFGYGPYSYYGHGGYYGHGRHYGHGSSGHRPGGAARTRSQFSGSAGFRGHRGGTGHSGGVRPSGGGAARTRGSAVRR